MNFSGNQGSPIPPPFYFKGNLRLFSEALLRLRPMTPSLFKGGGLGVKRSGTTFPLKEGS